MNFQLPNSTSKLIVQSGTIIMIIFVFHNKNTITKEFSEFVFMDKLSQFISFLIILIVILAGLLWWRYEEKSKKITNQHEKIFIFCQSCGKRFSSIRDYGRNEDGTIKNGFCEDCFSEGSFIKEKDDVIKEIETTIKEKDRKKNIIKRLEGLERWKKDEY